MKVTWTLICSLAIILGSIGRTHAESGPDAEVLASSPADVNSYVFEAHGSEKEAAFEFSGLPAAQIPTVAPRGRWDGTLPPALIGRTLVRIECVQSGVAIPVDEVQVVGDGYCTEVSRGELNTVEWRVHWPGCAAPMKSRRAAISSSATKPVPRFVFEFDRLISAAGDCDTYRVVVQP